MLKKTIYRSGFTNVVPVGTRSPVGINITRGAKAPKFLPFLVVLCFERRCPKQVKIFDAQKKFGLAMLLPAGRF